MAVLVFGLIYLVAATIFVVVQALAVGERARSFKAASPGMLPPLGDYLWSVHRIYPLGTFGMTTIAQTPQSPKSAQTKLPRYLRTLRQADRAGEGR
jgi:hypothetical protein